MAVDPQWCFQYPEFFPNRNRGEKVSDARLGSARTGDLRSN